MSDIQWSMLQPLRGIGNHIELSQSYIIKFVETSFEFSPKIIAWSTSANKWETISESFLQDFNQFRISSSAKVWW